MLAGGLSRHDPPAYLISSGLVWSRLVWSVLVWSVVVVEPQSLSSACIACALLDRGIALDVTCGRDRSDLHVAGAFFNLSFMTTAAFATCLCHHCHRPSR